MSRIKFTEKNENARNLADKKEVIETRVLLAVEDGKIKELMTARWYMSKSKSAMTIYCSIWCWSGAFGDYTSGMGKAGGGGYCKTSAAFASALKSAGIEHDHEIAGRGMYEVEKFMTDLANQFGYGVNYICRG